MSLSFTLIGKNIIGARLMKAGHKKCTLGERSTISSEKKCGGKRENVRRVVLRRLFVEEEGGNGGIYSSDE
jgi:hypothetical protein